MMKEIKEIMELHRENGGAGILKDGVIRVYNDKFNIYTDKIEYEPTTRGFKELAFVKVSNGEVAYTLYGDGSFDLDNAN